MSNEYKGHVTVQMLGAPVRVSYRVLWGAHPYIMDAHIREGDYYALPVSGMPDGVRVRIYDAIVADVREQEQRRMAEKVAL